jgi:beta-glucanase (GH16 family)
LKPCVDCAHHDRFELGLIMARQWQRGLAATSMAALALACSSLIESEISANAEQAPPAASALVVNTGQPASGAFLVDFATGYDEKTHYLAEYSMDEDWIKIAFRPENARFDKGRMTLVLEKTPGKPPYAGAEFQRRGRYGYGRYEVVMTASNAQGVVSSFFTHTNNFFDDPHDEIGFEFAGRDPRKVHLNYFRNGEGDPLDVPLWFDASETDHLFAFEWSPDSIRWFVDGEMVRAVTAETTKDGIPTTSSRVLANIWAGVGNALGWTGEPQFTRTTATYRCISHVPVGQTGRQCSDSFTPPPKP